MESRRSVGEVQSGAFSMVALHKWLVRNFAGSLVFGWLVIAVAGWSAVSGQGG
jgi:hypothetical protein